MKETWRRWTIALVLLLSWIVVSSCATAPGTERQELAPFSPEELLGSAEELPESVQIGAISLALPTGSSVVRIRSGAYRLQDSDGVVRGTAQFLRRTAGAGLAETAEYVSRSLPDRFTARSIPCRLGLYDGVLFVAEAEEETRFVLLLELSGIFFLLETDHLYAPLIHQLVAFDTVGSVRAGGELSFFAHDTGWHWVSDLDAGFLLHNGSLEGGVLLSVVPPPIETLPFGLDELPEGPNERSVRLYADYQWRDAPYRTFDDGERRYALLELPGVEPPATALFSIPLEAGGAAEARVEEFLQSEPVQELFRFGLLFGPAPPVEGRRVELEFLDER